MDYKKAYKEALERAKEIKSKLLSSHLSTESCKAVSEYIDTVIPELTESEDERIRKDIISIVKEYDRICEKEGDPCNIINDCLAYLDTLQEQPELPNKEIAEYYYHKGVYEGLSQGRADALKILDEFMKRKADPVIVIKQQEQPCEELEDAAKKLSTEWRKNPDGSESTEIFPQSFVRGFKAGAAWQAERLLKGFPMPEDTVIFQKGIEEGKRLMLEDAVEGYVNYYEDGGGILMAEAQVGCPYHNGDKVKIVIVKED